VAHQCAAALPRALPGLRGDFCTRSPVVLDVPRVRGRWQGGASRWVDADACPNVIKDLLFRAANRLGLSLTLVANQPLRTPPSPTIKVLQVPAGFDVADHTIAQHVRAGDLVVTADIPLAAQVIARGGHALNPRGTLSTRENMPEHLTMRHVMDELRQSGVDTGGPSPFSQRDRQAFANQLDRFLTRYSRTGSDTTG
jgi:uncharacterized protein YaiI (UPF0178 family)